MLINYRIIILIEIYEENFGNYKKTIKLEFYRFDTILSIKHKHKIQEKENINSISQILMYNQKILEDNKTLGIYNIEKDSKILLLIIKSNQSGKEEELIKIYVKTVTGKVIEIYIKSTDTINELKRIIYYKLGYEENYQRIIFAGKQLEDDETFKTYNIQKESIIHLVLRKFDGFFNLIKIVFNKENMNLNCEFNEEDNINIIKNEIKRLKNIDMINCYFIKEEL